MNEHLPQLLIIDKTSKHPSKERKPHKNLTYKCDMLYHPGGAPSHSLEDGSHSLIHLIF